MTKYATIVVDPPWAYDEGWPGLSTSSASLYKPLGEPVYGRRKPLGYNPLSVDEIAALPVADLADADAHLYLWTTNRYLFDARRVAEAWGFRYGQTLIWAKTPKGIGPGGTFSQNAEYILFCRRGTLKAKQRLDSVWFNWKRGAHSVKPDAMLDMVEQVSPGPYVELFARRARFGWDYWGDQSLGTAEMAA